MEDISRKLRDVSQWELLYADDFVVIAESEEMIKKLNRWNNGVQSTGVKVNMKNTKVMISGESRKAVHNTGRWPCGVCSRGVGRN